MTTTGVVGRRVLYLRRSSHSFQEYQQHQLQQEHATTLAPSCNNNNSKWQHQLPLATTITASSNTNSLQQQQQHQQQQVVTLTPSSNNKNSKKNPRTQSVKKICCFQHEITERKVFLELNCKEKKKRNVCKWWSCNSRHEHLKMQSNYGRNSLTMDYGRNFS